MYVCGVLFVLFIDFACELLWNVLVIQKGFLYITQPPPPDLFLIYNVYVRACVCIGDVIPDEILEICGN